MSSDLQHDTLDPAWLPLINSALARRGLMLRVPKSLTPVFENERDVQRRLSNRYVVAALTLLFDIFWWPQWWSVPDIVVASGVLRFIVYTPATCLFVGLDLSGRLGRLYHPLLLALALAPSLITAWLCLQTGEMVAQPEIYGTPLILLFTGALLRMPLPMVGMNAIICTLAYTVGLVGCPMLPRDQIATALFIQVAVGVAVVIFNLQLESRDRRVFLLTMNERIRLALVAEQNSGLLRQAQTDSLTGVANRRCFDETLSSRWLEAMRVGHLVSLLMIDVDKFKLYNDAYGHLMGDDCLRRVAGRLAAVGRKSDLVARYGGEEFAVILVGDSPPDSLAVAERMRTEIEAMALPHEGWGPGAIVTISIGLASVVPSDPNGARRLLELADENLYAAKHAGRNRVASSVSFFKADCNGCQSPL